MTSKKATTKANLNIRSSPSFNGTRIAVIPKGQEISILETSNPDETWLKIEGWVHRDFLTITENQPIPPKPQPPVISNKSKLGYHVMAGNRDFDLIRHIKRMRDIGKPIAGLTILFRGKDNTDLPRLIKKESPDTIILGRIYVSREPDAVNGDRNSIANWGRGDKWITDLSDQMKNEFVDYWQIANEWGTAMPEFPNSRQLEEVQDRVRAFTQFYIDAAEKAHSLGKVITLGDLSVGHIEEYALPFFAPMFEYASERGNPINYHAYNGDMSTPISKPMTDDAIYYAARFVRWSTRYPKVKFILGEAGAGDARYGNDPKLEILRMRELDKISRGETVVGNDMRAKNVLFFAWWSLFPHNDWLFSNFSEAIPEIENSW